MLRALPDILRIGLFYGEKVQQVELRIESGRYRFFMDGEPLEVLKAGERLRFQHKKEDLLKVDQVGQGIHREGSKMTLERLTSKGSFVLKKERPYPAEHLYPGELTVKSEEERLQCINRVGMSQYLSGVVLAEAGKGHHPEFYKVQAVICRTYALHNLDKFSDRGIHLCDKVACQVYRGMNTKEPAIDSAVQATEGIVIVDDKIRLITAAYHSNSGGKTAPSELPWSKALPYLRSVDDPFSKGGRHYKWEKKLPKKEWLAYLEREFDYPVEEAGYREHALSYCPEERDLYFLPREDSISLQKVREDLGLNSSFFRIEAAGDSVIFKGRGFGHGVGVSQEGAMRMAKLGVPYEEIVHYYYQGVHLVKIEALDFFRAD